MVAGRATKDGETIAFAGTLAIPDKDRSRWVDGVPVEATLSEGGTFVVTARPKRWLDRVVSQ